MTTYYRLCKHFWRRIWRITRFTALVLIGLELLCLLYQGVKANHAYAPYEAVLNAAWWEPLFLTVLVFLLGYILFHFLNDMTRESRAIYTLMTLPGPFWALPLAWATTFLATTCFLLCVQLVLAFSLYPLYLLLQQVAFQYHQQDILTQYHLDTWDFPAPGFRKGLSYAFLRSPFLRLLLPSHPQEIVLWCSRLLLPASLGTACLGERRWKRAGGVLLAAGVLANLHLFRISHTEYLFLWSGIALALELLLLLFSVLTFRHARNLA